MYNDYLNDNLALNIELLVKGAENFDKESVFVDLNINKLLSLSGNN